MKASILPTYIFIFGLATFLQSYKYSLNRIRIPFKYLQNRLKAKKVDIRDDDLNQLKDLDLILSERAKRFYANTAQVQKETCILVSVDSRSQHLKSMANTPSEDEYFSFEESLNELSELVGTAGLQVMGTCIQKLQAPNSNTYINSGKVYDVMALVNQTGTKTIVIDDDLSPKQQRNLESLCASYGGSDVKILDRTAVILEIFAQHATSREGQLQVELAMLEYRSTRGPQAKGGDTDSGCGFRGPGETKIETDKRVIRDKILKVKKEIEGLGQQRIQHRKTRDRLGLPVVALVGYTNAGKSTLMNRLTRAGVLAENMLFATLDPTTRKINIPRVIKPSSADSTSTVSKEEDNTWEARIDENDDTIEWLQSTSSPQLSSTDSIDSSTDNNNSDEDTSSTSTNSDESSFFPTVTTTTTATDDDDDDEHTIKKKKERMKKQQYFDMYERAEIAKGQEIFITDTVGFIAKLPTDLIAAFRATLEEVKNADVLIHVCDRSSPVWKKQRSTVLKELAAIGCYDIPIIEIWNKIDNTKDPLGLMIEADSIPIETDAYILQSTGTSSSSTSDSPILVSSILGEQSGEQSMDHHIHTLSTNTMSSIIEESNAFSTTVNESMSYEDTSYNSDSFISDTTYSTTYTSSSSSSSSSSDNSFTTDPTSDYTFTTASSSSSSSSSTSSTASKPVSNTKSSNSNNNNNNNNNNKEDIRRKKWTKLNSKYASKITSTKNNVGSAIDETNVFWSGEDDEYITDMSSSMMTSSTSTTTIINNPWIKNQQPTDSLSPSLITSHTTTTTTDIPTTTTTTTLIDNNNHDNDISSIKQLVYTVAVSAKSGMGFNYFLSILEKVLSLSQQEIEVFIPYERDDGIVTQIFNQGTIEEIDYQDTGTYIRCRLPDTTYQKAIKFQVL